MANSYIGNVAERARRNEKAGGRPNTPGETKQAGSYIGGSYKEPEYGERPKTPSGSGFPELTENETLLLGFGEKDAPKSIRNDEKVKAPYKTYESELKPDFKLPGERGGTESVFERSPFSNATRQKLGMEPNEDGVGDVIENKGNTEYPNSFLQNKANYSGLYATEQKMPEVQKANAGDYVSYVGNMFGAGLTSAPMNITSGLQTTLGDIKSGGEYSEGYKKIAEYLRDNPGAKDLIATPRASYWHLANEIGVPEAVLRSYRYANMSADVIEEIDENSNGVSGGFKNVAGNLAYQGGQMAFCALIGNAIAGGMGGGSSAYAEKAINYGLVGGDVFGGALTNTAKEYGDAGAKGYLYSVGNAATEVLTEALLGFGDLSSVQKIFSATGGNNVLNGLKALGKYLANSAGEGVEEVANTAVTGALEKALLDRTKKWVGNGGVFDWSEIGTNAGMGALGGLMFGAGGVVTAISNIKSETDGIRTAAEWLAGYNAQLPEGYKVDMKPVGQITEKDIEAYEKQIVENTEQYMEDVALPEMFARQEARLENVPESEKPKTPSEMTAESFVEYAKEVQRVVESRSSADPAAQEFLDLVQQANAPAAPTPATPAQQTNAQDIIDAAIAQIQSGGVVTNSAAAAVLANPEAVQSLGVNTAGLTASQQRAAVKNAVAQMVAENAQKNTASEVETVIPMGDTAAEIRYDKDPKSEILDEIKKSFGVLYNKPSVAQLTGKEFQKSSADKRSLRQKVIDFFNSIGNAVERADMGRIELNNAGARDSTAHGYGPVKAATYASLPDVLKNGEVIYSREPYEGHGYYSYIIAAPVNIGEETVYVGALVIKDRTQRYKLHEVLVANKNGTPLFQSEATENSGPLRNDAPPEDLMSSLTDTIIADESAGVKEDSTAPDVQNASDDGLGAAAAGFTGDVERGFSRNIATDTNRNAELQEDFTLDPEMYHRLSNKDTQKKAEDIFAQGVEYARETVETALTNAENGKKFAPEMVPLAKLVADEMARRGEMYTARSILARTAVQLTEAGQLGQAAVILRNSGPATMISTVEKVFARINAALPKRTKWRAELTDADIKAIQEADYSDPDAIADLYDNIARRIGKEMPSTLWEKLTEIRRVAMLLNPRTSAKNLVGNVPLLGVRKVSEGISGAIQTALVKLGAIDPSEQTRVMRQGKESREIAKELYEANLDAIKGNANKYDMNALLRQYRKYFPNNKVGHAMDAVREFTYAVLERGDSPFMKSAFIDSAAGYIKAQGYKSASEVPQEVIDFAMQNALEATFKDASALSKAINNTKRKGGVWGAVLDVLFPFTTTPINIGKRLFEYSPLNFITVASDVVKQEAAAKTIDDLAKTLTGSGVVALGFLLRKLGAITGGRDKDKDKAAFDKATGNSPYSFGGRVSYDWSQPVGSMLAMGAEIADVLDENQEWYDALANVVYTTGDSFLEMSFFADILDLMKGYGSPTETVMESVITDAASQFTPSAFGAVARTADDTVRTTYTGGGLFEDALASVMNKVPGTTYLLPPSVNVKGEENKRAENVWFRAFNEFLNPATVNVAAKAEADEFVEDVYEATGDKTIFPSVSERKVEYKGNEFVLTGQEYAEVQKDRGTTYYDIVDLLLNSDSDISPEQQAEILYLANVYAGAEAKQTFLESKGVEYELTGEASSVEKAMRADNPVAYMLVNINFKDGTGEQKNADLVEKAMTEIDAMGTSDKEKVFEEIDGVEKAWNLHNAGLSAKEYFVIKSKYDQINKMAGKSAVDKKVDFSVWASNMGYTKAQRDAILGSFQFGTYMPAKTDTYDKGVSAGLDESTASGLYYDLSELEPLPGKTSVTSAQKYDLITNYDGLSEQQKLDYLDEFIPDSQESTYQRFLLAFNEGIPLSEFTEYWYTMSDFESEKDANGKEVKGKTRKDKVVSYIKSLGIRTSWKEFLFKQAYPNAKDVINW